MFFLRVQKKLKTSRVQNKIICVLYSTLAQELTPRAVSAAMRACTTALRILIQEIFLELGLESKLLII